MKKPTPMARVGAVPACRDAGPSGFAGADLGFGQLKPLVVLAAQLPSTQGRETQHKAQTENAQDPAPIHVSHARSADNGPSPRPRNHVVQKLLIIAFLILILWNLGAGLYYMMVDKGKSDRTVKSLTWRIGLSVALILLVVAGIYSGVIKPHGVGG
jgi:hypothetical protein